MAVEWFYQKSGTEFGPVTSSHLKQLAQTGQLLPTDKVRKGGSTTWHLASQVQGLCEATQPRTSPASTQPPSIPSSPVDAAPPTNAGSTPPDLGAAAKQFWSAAKAKAKEVGQRAAEAAKEMQAKAQASQAQVQVSQAPASQAASVQPGSAPAATGTAGEPNTTAPASTGPSVPKLTKGPVLGCLACIGVLVVCAGVLQFFGIGSGSDSLGISEDKFLRPKPGMDLKSTMAEAGCPLKVERDEAGIRVWSLGPKTKLAVTGPRDNLTGIFLLCGYTANETDNAKSVALTLFTVGSVFNVNSGSSATMPPGSTEADKLMDLFSTLMREKKSGGKVVNGVFVGFQNCAPVSYQVGIQSSKKRAVDPIDIFELGPGAKLLMKPLRE